MSDDPLSISASPKTRPPARRWLWPEIIDLESARAAARDARNAAIFVAVATVVFVLLSIMGTEFLQPLGLDAWGFVDAAIFLVVAWGIHRMSRTAAVAGLIIYIAERLLIMLEAGSRGIILTIILTLLFIHGVRGTFAFHRFRAAGNDPAIPEIFS